MKYDPPDRGHRTELQRSSVANRTVLSYRRWIEVAFAISITGLAVGFLLFALCDDLPANVGNREVDQDPIATDLPMMREPRERLLRIEYGILWSV